MEEEDLWIRALESAIDGRTTDSPIITLTLDGSVTSFNGRLPSPILFEKFQALEHLSIANVGLTSLEMFPRLWNLQTLVLSDNRISGGLEFLVQAGLRSLRDLDLSNNRIANVVDLLPLAQLDLVSLDLNECPVTRVSDYRGKIFRLIKSLKCLDKLDVDEDDGEVDGAGVDLGKISNGVGTSRAGVRVSRIDINENEESDEDGVEEDRDELSIVNLSNGALNDNLNGYRVDGEEIDDHDHSEESEGVEEMQEIEDIVEEEEGVENAEEVEHVIPESSRTVIHSRGEIDGHEEGEDDSDNDGEYEEDGEEDEELGFQIRPAGQVEGTGEPSDLDPLNEVYNAEEIDDEASSDLDPLNEIDDGDDAEEIHDEYPNTEFQPQPSSSSPSQAHLKRKRPEVHVCENDEDDDNDSVQDG